MNKCAVIFKYIFAFMAFILIGKSEIELAIFCIITAIYWQGEQSE